MIELLGPDYARLARQSDAELLKRAVCLGEGSFQSVPQLIVERFKAIAGGAPLRFFFFFSFLYVTFSTFWFCFA